MEYYNILETVLIICSAHQGEINIYLKKKAEEPYKNYWTLPSIVLNNETTLEDSALDLFKKMTNLEEVKMFQSKSFSKLDREPSGRIIASTFVCISDKQIIDMKNESEDKAWFKLSELPKLGFDHSEIIEEVTNEIKKKVVTNYDDIILDFFPSDFTLPELQSFYESVLGKQIDRRNFHKKFVTQNLVIDTGLKTSKGSGRPGKLYRFNVDKMKGKRI